MSLNKINITSEDFLMISNIVDGLYHPVTKLTSENDYKTIIESCRMGENRDIWPFPMNIRTEGKITGSDIELYFEENHVATIRNSNCFEVNIDYEVHCIFGTNDKSHPGVEKYLNSGTWCLSGDIELYKPFKHLIPGRTFTPKETKLIFKEWGWEKIVGFQTRNPIHRAHEYLIKCSLENADGVFINPLVGWQKADDIPHATRHLTYQETLKYFPEERATLGYFPSKMFYAGPREALYHAICRRNYGCTHFIVGRDHAGVGGFYGTYEAQEFVSKFEEDLGIEILKYEHAFWCTICGGMASGKTCPHGKEEKVFLSGTEVRRRLENDEEIPEEFSRHGVVKILRESS